MSEWREQDRRTPRKGEIVRDQEGNLGRVFLTESTLLKRKLWIQDVKGTEIYSGEDAEGFQIVDSQTTLDFQKKRYEHMGYRVGALCSYKGNLNIPLEILQMDWNLVRYEMTICMRDRRNFKGEIMKTEKRSLVVPFNLEFPPAETIFSTQDSGLKYRLEVNLVEKDREGWTNSGSPWEFFRAEEALEEVENWKSRLKIRRVASVLSTGWKMSFPCWTVEAIREEEEILTRVREVESLNGSPGYFRSALHASLAAQMLEPQVWFNALSSSQDSLNF